VVAHLVSIDLEAPGIELVVTPPEPSLEGQHLAKKTSVFLEEEGLQLAVNGSFFEPFHSHGPWDYYPHAGDPVSVLGLAVFEGKQYAAPRQGYANLCISREGEVTLGEPPAEVRHALPGREVFVQSGRVRQSYSVYSHADEPSPRTVVGLDATGRRLFFVVVDGRQPRYSRGATLPEVGRIAVSLGADRVLHLDGGGSTTLVVTQDGRPSVLNRPIHTRIPGRERPVANHLGVRARHEG
jgi:hypothetical protein